MDVSIVTSTRNNNHAFELLKGFNYHLESTIIRGEFYVKIKFDTKKQERIQFYSKYKAKHDKLLKQASNKKLTPEEQFQARLNYLKYLEMPQRFVLEIDVTSLKKQRGI